MNDHVIDGLATFRLTRLITKDSLTKEARGLIVRSSYASAGHLTEGKLDDLSLAEWSHVPSQDERAPKLAELVSCPWCASVYVSFGVIFARRFFPRAWSPIARALALSAFAGATNRALQ